MGIVHLNQISPAGLQSCFLMATDFAEHIHRCPSPAPTCRITFSQGSLSCPLAFSIHLSLNEKFLEILRYNVQEGKSIFHTFCLSSVKKILAKRCLGTVRRYPYIWSLYRFCDLFANTKSFSTAGRLCLQGAGEGLPSTVCSHSDRLLEPLSALHKAL